METASKRDWGMLAAGIALIIVGFVFLWAPGLTLVSIAAVVGAMFLAVGAFDVYAYVRHRRSLGLSGWLLAYAVCDIVLGVVFLIHPILAAEVIPWVAGAFMAAYGIFEIVVHDMPKEQAVRYVDQLRDFYTAGWLKLIGQS